MLEGHSCDRFWRVFFPPNRCRKVGTGSTGQNHNCSVLVALTAVCNMDLVLPWSSPLQEKTYVASLNSPEEQKSGTAISPENESYSWSLHPTVQSLQASSQLFWKLLNSRDEDGSVFPSPALPQHCLGHVTWLPPEFSTGVTLARDLHQKLSLMDEIFNPQSKNQLQQQHSFFLLMEARFSQRIELFLWSKPALMRGQLQLNRSSSLLCQDTSHAFCFCSTADVAHEAEAVS